MYDTWCVSVTPDILNIPEIPYIPVIPEVHNILDIPLYYHAKYGCPRLKIGQVTAIFIMGAKFVPKQEQEKEQQHIFPL